MSRVYVQWQYDQLRDMSDDVVVDGETNGTAMTCIPVDWPENRQLVTAAHPRWRSHEVARLKWKNWILRILSYLVISIQYNTPSQSRAYTINWPFQHYCYLRQRVFLCHPQRKSINISEEPTNTAAKWVNLTAQHMISSVPLPEPLSLCRPSWVSSFSLDFFPSSLRRRPSTKPSKKTCCSRSKNSTQRSLSFSRLQLPLPQHTNKQKISIQLGEPEEKSCLTSARLSIATRVQTWTWSSSRQNLYLSLFCIISRWHDCLLSVALFSFQIRHGISS